ncbi:MAG: hypothetical protein KJI71_03790 [Patescibacteria group bacterium]|nr:hypothetical protein [Patescibacteria group bacterium]
MVNEIQKKGKTFYQCGECKFIYLTKELAEKCENWCRENNSCNLDIIKQAVEIDKEK